MKKIILFLISILSFSIIPVNAQEYNVKELIPVNQEATVTTDTFQYNNFYYNDNKQEESTSKNNYIIFKSIKNLTDKKLPISISIALFDKDKKNIGTMNYCSSKDKTSKISKNILESQKEKSYVMEVNKKYLVDGKKEEDIEYISILSDNLDCLNTGNQTNAGKTIEEITKSNQHLISQQTQLLLKILTGIAIFIVIYFLYKMLFYKSNLNRNKEDKS